MIVTRNAVQAAQRPAKIEVPKKKNLLPSTERAAKGLSLKSLFRSTPAYVKMKSQEDVVVKKLTKTSTRGGAPAVVAHCLTPGSTVKRVSIIGMDKEEDSIVRQKRVLVSCPCEDFTFTWEYALWTWGASHIKYCNGDPAVVRNPGNYPGMCKHLVAVAKIVLGQKY